MSGKLNALLREAEGIQLDVQIFRGMGSNRVHVIAFPERCRNPYEGQKLAEQIMDAATSEAKEAE